MLLQSEKECAYYLRTGQCKFGSTCKFHHPQPSTMMVAVRGSGYSPGQSATSPGQHAYQGAVTSWPLSRSASFIASPRWPGHSSYAQVLVPPGLVQVPGWNPYTVCSMTSFLLFTWSNNCIYHLITLWSSHLFVENLVRVVAIFVHLIISNAKKFSCYLY